MKYRESGAFEVHENRTIFPLRKHFDKEMKLAGTDLNALNDRQREAVISENKGPGIRRAIRKRSTAAGKNVRAGDEGFPLFKHTLDMIFKSRLSNREK